MVPRPCNFVDLGAIGSAKTALQTPARPFSQNRLLLSLTPSSSVMNHRRRAPAARSARLDRRHHIHSFRHRAERYVMTIQPGSGALCIDIMFVRPTTVMKNWDPFVSLPALAIDTIPGRSCFIANVSSAK